MHWMEKVRPQILAAMLFISLLAGMAVFIGSKMDAAEIVTGAIGTAISGLLALGMKVLEKQD
jgi:carbamate kinase